MKNNKKLGIILFSMAVCLILIVLTAYVHGVANNPESTSESLDAPTSIVTEFVVPDWVTADWDDFTDYSSIIEEYRNFAEYAVEFKYNGEQEGTLWYDWSGMGALIAVNPYHLDGSVKTRGNFGYALKDLNGNGNDELILLLRNYTVMAIFSMVDGKPKLLDEFWSRHQCAIDDSGLLYVLSSGGGACLEYAVYSISQDGTKLLPVEQFGKCNGYFKVIDGKRHDIGERHEISESEFDELYKRFPFFNATTAEEITKNSGIEFIPLFETKS